MFNKKKEYAVFDASALVHVEPTKSEKRKYLELALVQTIEAHISKGLDINYITIDLSHGVDVRVVLNETTQTAKQTTGDDTEGTETT